MRLMDVAVAAACNKNNNIILYHPNVEVTRTKKGVQYKYSTVFGTINYYTYYEYSSMRRAHRLASYKYRYPSRV